MALLFVDSFDHYQTDEITAKWSSEYAGYEILPGKGRCDTQALRMWASSGHLIKGLSFGGLTGTIGLAGWLDDDWPYADSTGDLFSFGNATTQQLTIRRYPDGSVAIIRRDVPNNEGLPYGDYVLGLTPPDVMRKGRWYSLEFKAFLDLSNGEAELRINNIPQLTMSGVRTWAVGTTLALRRIELHGGPSRWLVDDLYVCDDIGDPPWTSFLGDIRIEYLRPTASGAHQDWAVVNSSSHWAAVDDNADPNEDNSFVASKTPGETDTNRYQPTGLPAGPIFGAQLSLYLKKSEIGPRTVAAVARSGGEDHVGDPYAPSATSYIYLVTPYQTNPITGQPWTIAEINAAEFGVTVLT